jgi:hypothetical protein
MRVSTAYFAGVGTVIVAVAAGLGGGYLAANIANPPSPGVSKLERRMSAEPISVAAAPTQPAPKAVAPNPASAQEQPQPQTEAAAPPDNPSAAITNVRAEAKAASHATAVQPAKSTEQKSAEQIRSAEQAGEKTATPRDAFAKARDADVKRADAERRRAERRQAWAERRRVQQPRGPQLEAVEERVREVTEPRRIRIRQEGEPMAMFAEQPSRTDMPRIRLFDQDD